MTARGTAALVGVLIVLAGYLWLVEHPRRPVNDTPPFLTADVAAAARIELVEPTGRLTIVRADDGWQDTGGRSWPSGAPGDLLEALATLRPVIVVDDEPDAVEDYGLGHDAARLRVLDSADRPLLQLDIGRRNPAWTGVYVRRADSSQVLLVGSLLRWEIEKLRRAAPSPAMP